MRALLVLTVLLAAAAPAAAAPQLVGTDGHGPVTLLDADLEPVPGSLQLPRGTDGTVLSPNGRRLATWRFAPGTITLRDAATGTPQQTLKGESGQDVYWPTRFHVLTVDADPPIVVRSSDVRRGMSAVTRLPGHLLDQAPHGQGVRLLIGGGSDRGGFTVYDIGAGGKVKRRVRLQRPQGVDAGAAGALLGDRVLVSQREQTTLVGLDGTVTPLALPPGYWSPQGEAFVSDGKRIATLDRATGTVGPLIDAPGPYTPYDGGLITGLGRARYDAEGHEVAANPAADTSVTSSSTLVANGRLYALTYDCDATYLDYGMRIIDADSGAAVRTRPGSAWRVGVLGAGYMPVLAYDDDCD